VRVCVVLLNYNGWADTLECLESVLRGGPELTVVVCDNASTDGSPERLRAWAEGRLDSWVRPDNPLRSLSFPPLPKPVPFVEYGRDEAERGGAREDGARLVLVRTGGNLGYAGGNNVGLRYALARGFDAVWLLNNDTVVRPDTLAPMVEEMRRDPRVGIVGSTLLYYHDPATVQARGGARYNPWLALPRHLGAGQPAGLAVDAAEVERRLAYVTGASMLVSSSFLREVGLMSEDYFLYFEEIDWATRGAGRFRMAYAPESVVFHREGGTIGARAGRKTALADYHFMRNRILYTRKYRPAALPTVYFALAVAALRRAGRGEWDRARMIARLCWGT
jgi:GT2 family glycosyltransferase